MLRRAAALLAAPLLVITACAKEADDGAIEVRTGAEAVSALRAAPDAAADAGTAQFEVVVATTADDEALELVATGAFDKAAHQARVTMDLAPLFDQLAAGMDLGADVDDATMETVIDDGTVYLRSPLFALFSDVDGWLSATPEGLGASAQVPGLGSTDPTAVLEALRGVGADPEVVGSDEVRGVPTTHYRATMTVADALEQIPEADRAEAEAAFEQLADADAEIPVDVWIDGDGLPRRLRVDLGSTLAVPGTDGDLTMTLELFGYGEPVDIEVPPADEVTPAADLLSGIGGMLGS